MKKIIALLVLVTAAITLFAQTPQAICYQAVATDTRGNELVSQSIKVRLSILKGTASGSEEWVEVHSVTTDGFGLFDLSIGSGTRTGGTQTLFSAIKWGTDKYYLKVEMDVTGGNRYVLMGTNQLVSVPYALYAERSSTTIYADSSKYANRAGTAALADSAAKAGRAAIADSARIALTSVIALTSHHTDTAFFAITAGTARRSDTATIAITAVTARRADSSIFATTSNFAATARRSDTATFAWLADSSRRAGTATYATLADSSRRAGTATYATLTDSSRRAGTATYATLADSSRRAGTATYATLADSSRRAGTAIYATLADSSRRAGTAIYATLADSSRRAGTAIYATLADSTRRAGTAIYATLSDSTRRAGTATYAILSDSTRRAGTATYATLADSTRRAQFSWTSRRSDTAQFAWLADSARRAQFSWTSRRSDTTQFAWLADSTRRASSAYYSFLADSSRRAGVATLSTLADSSRRAGTAAIATKALTAIDDNDKDPTNEIQTLSFDTLTSSLKLTKPGGTFDVINLSQTPLRSPGASIEYPFGILGEALLITSNYTVPTGKTLFVSAVNNPIELSDGTMLNIEPGMPIIPSGVTIRSCFCSGILVTNQSYADPIIINFSDPLFEYQIPTGKYLILKSGTNGSRNMSFLIDGTNFDFFTGSSSSSRLIVLPEGKRIRKGLTNVGSFIVSGYLLKK